MEARTLVFSDNKFWYYFYDLEVTVDPPTTDAQTAMGKDADTDDYEKPEVDISGGEP